MRVFVAVTLESQCRLHVLGVMEELKACGGDVRWVRGENLHLTLAFLGEIEACQVRQLNETLRESCRRHAPFLLEWVGLGAFPDLFRPRVVWVGTNPCPGLVELHHTVMDVVTHLGMTCDGRFNPHLTVGRVKNSRDCGPLCQGLKAKTGYPLGHQQVDSLTVYSSDLHRGGPIYTPLANIPFKSSLETEKEIWLL